MKRSKLVCAPAGTEPSLVSSVPIIRFTHSNTGTWDGVVDTSGAGSWDFGDGSAVYVGDDPSHDYSGSGAGPFTVTLTLSDWADLDGDFSFTEEDISSVTGMVRATGITEFELFGNTSLAIGLSQFESHTQNLLNLDLENTDATGDVSSVAGLVNLDRLFVNGSRVAGDVSQLALLTQIIRMWVNGSNVAYGSGAALANMNAIYQFYAQDCGWDTATVDRVLADLAGNVGNQTGSNKTLKLEGTNAAPTSGAADIATLEANGWTVTANEAVVTFDHTETGVWNGTVDTSGVGVWDWGDASGTYTGDDPSHDYSSSGAGPFTVTLTLPQWSDLTSVTLANEGITSVSSLGNATSLTRVYLYSNPSLSVDVGEYTSLTDVERMYIYGTNATGDISSLSGFSALTTIRLFSTDVTYGIGGGFASMDSIDEVRLDGCALPTADVDRVLADLASNVGNQAPSGKTVNVGGNNAAPTGGASNADVITLEANGWTVTHS